MSEVAIGGVSKLQMKSGVVGSFLTLPLKSLFKPLNPAPCLTVLGPK